MIKPSIMFIHTLPPHLTALKNEPGSAKINGLIERSRLFLFNKAILPRWRQRYLPAWMPARLMTIARSLSGCRIWSWSPMPCEKHGPRDSVDKNRGRRPRFLSLLRPEGHVFHTAWETMIKSYYSTPADWFFLCFIHVNMNFDALKWAIFGSLHGC